MPLLQAEDARYRTGLIGMVAEASADQVGADRATLARFLDVTVRDV
jgi:hypothetical protein